MNDRFGRGGRYREDMSRRDPYARDPYGRERDEQRDWRLRDSDRVLRSPDQEFETSANYREPTEAYGETYGNRPSYGRSRFDDRYAPSYPTYPENRYGHSGRGPKGYVRTDERIREDVCDRLSWDDEVDATDIAVRVENGEVTLEGSVETRHMKRLAEDIAEGVPGVTDVHNTVRVKKAMLSEIKEKITGEAQDQHYANTGTKNTGHHSRNGVT
jgi:hypothetical protein